MARLNPERPWLSLRRLARDHIEKQLWTSAGYRKSLENYVREGGCREEICHGSKVRFVFKLKTVRFTILMTTTSATRKEKTNFLPTMCERFLAMWAELPAIMAYVIDNGEIHAGPNIDAGG